MNRFLARDVKSSGGQILAKRNDVIDSDTVNKLLKHGVETVHVQSPLTDPTPGDGFSSYSYGVDYDKSMKKRGDNIGIMSAHTLTEPAVNMAMKSFHTGGTFTEGKQKAVGTVFDSIDRMLRFNQNLPDKATLASIHGKVKSIEKSPIGGWDVVIGNNTHDERRYVHPLRDLVVKTGDTVAPGDYLSDGTASPHDMLKYKGMKEAQKYLVSKIDEINEGKLDKRDIETIVRGITNTTRIMHPGSSTFVPGDVAPLSTVEYFNRQNKKEKDVDKTFGHKLAEPIADLKEFHTIDHETINNLGKRGIKRVKVYEDPIVHEPFLTPTGIQAKAQSSEDWISRLAHNRLRQVLEEGTTQSWKSSVDKDKHPLPQYITGTYTW